MSNGILTYSRIGLQHTSTKECLMNATVLQLLTKSYASVHLSEIATACHIKQASVYHHFPNGKESIILAIIERTYRLCQSRLFILLTQPNISLNEKIAQFTQETRNFFTQSEDAIVICLLISQFIDSEKVKTALQKYISAWIEAIQSLFATILIEQESTAAANKSMERIHGAILMARLFDDHTYICNACDEVVGDWLRLIACQKQLSNNQPTHE